MVRSQLQRTGHESREGLTGSFSGSLYGYFSSTLPAGAQVSSFLLVGMALFAISFLIPVVAPVVFALNYGRKRRTLPESLRLVSGRGLSKHRFS